MSKGLFKGGVPTNAEVRRLMELRLDPGDEVSFEDVAETIGERINSNRFNSVTTAWRNKLKTDRGIRVNRGGGVFRLLLPHEAVEESQGDVKRVGRSAARTLRTVKMIDVSGLEGAQLQKYHLIARQSAALRDAASDAYKEIVKPQSVSANAPIRRIGTSQAG